MLAERKDVIESCLIQTQTVIVKEKDVVLKKGPCTRIDGEKCGVYIFPAAKWRAGNCPMATHLIIEEDEHKFKNPLKASKQKQKQK